MNKIKEAAQALVKAWVDFVLSIFGQDEKRKISTKTVLAYSVVGSTIVLWFWAFLTKSDIPHIGELKALNMVVLVSYFGVGVAKVLGGNNRK